MQDPVGTRMQKQIGRSYSLFLDYQYITMSLLMTAYVAVLFYALVPGILVSIPAGGDKMTKAAVHAVVFAIVYQLTHKWVWKILHA